jgi:hypothetical protein
LGRITAELSCQSFGQIGSLYPINVNGQSFRLGRLVTEGLGRFSSLHNQPPRLTELFRATKCPFLSTTKYTIAMANMRLMHEATISPAVNDDFVEMWLFRSLVTSMVAQEFDRGPFLLKHGSLARSAILVDDHYNLTGIINWDSDGAAARCCHKPAIPHSSPNKSTTEDFCVRLNAQYLDAVKFHEQEIRKTTKTNLSPALNGIAFDGGITSANFDLISQKGDRPVSDDLWQWIFKRVFGEIDRNTILKIYRNAPGVVSEFNRTKEFLSAIGVDGHWVRH